MKLKGYVDNDYIDENRDLAPTEKDAILCEKECELNRKERLFTKQTLAIRYYQVVSEKNLKDNIML